MIQSEELSVILERIAKGEDTGADLQRLRDLLNQGDRPPSVLQVGKYAVNIQQVLGQVHIGDRLELTKENIQSIAKAICSEINKAEASQATEKALVDLRAASNNLPIPLTSFVGRKEEMKKLKCLLTKTRLLTLTGAAGCGKTRLALEVATTLFKQYSDGVWLVELADLVDPDLVPQTVAKELKVPIPKELNRPLNEILINFLRLKSVLLILDNCEHLIEACAYVATELLHHCPKLRILVTSRENLRSEEICWTVPPLSLPQISHQQAPADLIQCDAVKLFIERAKASQSDFAVTDQNALSIAKICRQLDGLPLAIELAAAWVNTLSMERISEEVKAHRFKLLRNVGTGKPVPHHHATLQATITWSYSKLQKLEQLLFQRLSIFVGGWSLEAVEESCTDERVKQDNVVHLLRILVEKSLIVAKEQQGGEKRYHFLESIRDYSRNELEKSGEAQELHRRHRDWFLRLLEQAKPELLGKSQKVWLERLETEQDNFRAALDWAVDHEADKALRLAWLLSLFWDTLGQRSEAYEALETALKRVQDPPIELHICALNQATLLAVYQADCDRAQELAKQLLDLSREAELDLEATLSQQRLGQIMFFKGEFEIARSLFRKCLKQFKRLNALNDYAWCLHNLGMLATDKNEFALAQRFFEKALDLHQKLKNNDGTAQSLVYLAFVMHKQCNRSTVASLLDKAQRLLQKPEGRNYLCWCLHFRGRLSVVDHNFSAARTYFYESLKIFQKGSDKKLGIIRSLLGLSYLSAKENHWELSVRLLGAEEAHREEMGLPSPSDWRDEIKFCRDGGLNALGQDTFEQAWEEGRATSWEEAVKYVLPDFNH